MKKDKYCINCDHIPKSEAAIYCELCGSTLLLFSERYCDSGCVIIPSSDDKYCSKCGNDLFPIRKDRICSEADCDRTIPQDQLIQLYLNNDDYKNLPSEWKNKVKIQQLCLSHLFAIEENYDGYCKLDMCTNTADPAPKFAADLCVVHFMDLVERRNEPYESNQYKEGVPSGKHQLEKCHGAVCDELWFDPYGIPHLMLTNETPRLQCYYCHFDENEKFIEEYKKIYNELITLYEKHNKEPGFSWDPRRLPNFSPYNSRRLSFMKEEIYKLTDQSPLYEICIRCGKNNIPTVAEYCMVCLRSTKEYANHWFEKVEERRKRYLPGCGYGRREFESRYHEDNYYWVGRCGLCFDLDCLFNWTASLKDEDLFPWQCKVCRILLPERHPDGNEDLYANCLYCKQPVSTRMQGI